MESIITRLKVCKAELSFDFSLKGKTELFTQTLFELLFDSQTDVDEQLPVLAKAFEELVTLACWQSGSSCTEVWGNYVRSFPTILEVIKVDAASTLAGDPASNSLQEIYLAYPGFFAIAIYRLAHPLYKLGFPLVPRLMTEYAHRKTGVDIHPGAQIGKGFFIDHATGVVIGETTVIEENVNIYQGVTLGALYVDKSLQNTKRHPTICSGVTIYANATILGGDTVIGAHSIIGGNAWITSSIPPYTKVYHRPENQQKITT